MIQAIQACIGYSAGSVDKHISREKHLRLKCYLKIDSALLTVYCILVLVTYVPYNGILAILKRNLVISIPDPYYFNPGSVLVYGTVRISGQWVL